MGLGPHTAGEGGSRITSGRIEPRGWTRARQGLRAGSEYTRGDDGVVIPTGSFDSIVCSVASSGARCP